MEDGTVKGGSKVPSNGNGTSHRREFEVGKDTVVSHLLSKKKEN